MNSSWGGRSARPYWVAAVLALLGAAWLPLWPLLQSLFTAETEQAILDARTLGLLWRTTWISLCASLLALALGWPYGVMVRRLRFPSAALLRLAMPLPLFLPPLMTAQAWYGLTGMSGPWATVFTFGLCYAPLPALLVSRSLRCQQAAAAESALLLGPRQDLKVAFRHSRLSAIIGASFVFLFAASDFAVPDYFSVVGELFHVYAAEVFGYSREADYAGGALASLPLVTLSLVVPIACAAMMRRQLAREDRGGRPALPIDHRPWRGPATALGLLLLFLLLLAPLGRILWETGMQGPLSERSWGEVSSQAFADATLRGREDLLRSLRFAGLGALFCLGLAPLWAHLLLRGRDALRLPLLLLLCLPMLIPSVALGFGSILMFNRPWLEAFYSSVFLPAMLIAGRFLPIAVFLLMDAMSRTPTAQVQAARLHGCAFPYRLLRIHLGGRLASLGLAAGMVLLFGLRELDFAILLPAANASAAVRYYNALHFARDNFVAAYGLLIVALLFLPFMLHATWKGLRRQEARR